MAFIRRAIARWFWRRLDAFWAEVDREQEMKQYEDGGQ